MFSTSLLKYPRTQLTSPLTQYLVLLAYLWPICWVENKSRRLVGLQGRGTDKWLLLQGTQKPEEKHYEPKTSLHTIIPLTQLC